VVLWVALSLASAACGLSSGAAGDLGRAIGQGGGLGSSGLSGGSASGSSGATGGGGSSTAGGAGGLGGTGGVSSASATGALSGGGQASGGGGAGGGGAVAAGGGTYETIGISGNTINLGIHAPASGAAPVPLQAFAQGAKLFWENHTVFGHQVVMTFMDDQYNPSVARQVCETMSRQDFLVVGGAGTDQIQACATDPVLAQSHTPYLSDGVTTNGLTGLANYFAISQTYAAQSPEVFAMTSQLYGGDANKTWAVVVENTPNFTDTEKAMDAVLSQHGVHYCNVPTPKYFSEADAQNAVTAAHQTCGASVVYMVVDPNFWIDMVREAQSQVYAPDWVGPGLTNGEDLVAGPVCGEQTQIKAAFLSPFPGLDKEPAGFHNESNPAPDQPAAERDLEMDVYGVSEVVYQAMLSVGSIQNLTRDNFAAAMSRFSASYGSQLSVYRTLNFNGGHFGGTGAWEEQLDCTQQKYTTPGVQGG
jgi:ABC-type branched-subunit amino acid transport system substrate-binding protein